MTCRRQLVALLLALPSAGAGQQSDAYEAAIISVSGGDQQFARRLSTLASTLEPALDHSDTFVANQTLAPLVGSQFART